MVSRLMMHSVSVLDPNIRVVVFNPHVFVRVVLVDRVNCRVGNVPGAEHRADFVMACLFAHICPRRSYPDALWRDASDVPHISRHARF